MGRLIAKAVGVTLITVSALCCGIGDSGPVIIDTSTAVDTLVVTRVDENSIAVERLTLSIGDTAALAASANNLLGQLVAGVEIFWVSMDPSVASVTDEGVIRALSEGSTEIQATGAGITVTIPLTVNDPSGPPTLVSIELSPTSVTMQPGAGSCADSILNSIMRP